MNPFKIIAVLSLFLATAVTGSAQMRRIMVHTTAQSLAMTDNGCQASATMHFSTEIIEAYENEYVDEAATFPGGYNALVHFINTSRHYPAEAYRNGIQGRVICSFVVQPDGSITHINILKGIEPSLDREAVRIIDSMPLWNAARVDGNPVPVLSTLAINFRL